MFFFHRGPPAARATHAPDGDMLFEELLAAPRDGVGIEAEKRGEPRVPAVAQFERLQPGKQPALLFVEQTIEQHEGGAEFLGRDLERGGVDHDRDGLGGTSGLELLPVEGGIGGRVEIHA